MGLVSIAAGRASVVSTAFLGVVTLATLATSSCRPPGPAPLVASQPSPSNPARLPAQSSPFVPPAAEPNRKAQFLALVPKIDALLAARAAAAQTTGAAVAIVLEGEAVYVRGFGVRDHESKQPVDGDTVFRVGSVSKTITALAVLKLRDQGRVELDAPAAPYVPALASLPSPTKDSPPLTVRHLLTMTSGLPYDDMWGAVTFGQSDAELAELIAQGPSLAAAPGGKYRYSNLGFALLGKIVEAVSGQPFAEHVAGEVFAPLGMTSSGFVTGAIPRERMAVGYFKDGDRFVPEPIDSDGVFAPAGGVYTTANDLARYAAYHLAAYPPRDDAETGPVRRSTLREMHAGQAWARWADDFPVLRRLPNGAPSLTASSYGLGWMQNTTCFAEGIVQHFGFEPGYWASIRLLPAQGLGMVTLSTTESLGRDETFASVLELLREHDVLDRAPAPPPPALIWARDTIVQLLAGWNAELVERTFDPLTRRYSFVRGFQADMETIHREHGKCRAEGNVIPLSATHGRFQVRCERGAIDIVALLTPHPAPLIQTLELRRQMPVTESDRAMAAKLVSSLAEGSPLPANALASGVAPRPLEQRLARLRATYGACSLDEPLWNDGAGGASFQLRCSEGPLELSLRVDPETFLLRDFSAAPPRAFGAVCAD
jgi:CubicO group peptidase (beta-lactamase class C family)